MNQLAMPRMGAILELRDKLSRQLGTAGRNVKNFGREVRTNGAHLTKFGDGATKMSRKVLDAFGSRMSGVVKNFFMGLKFSAAIGVATLGAFATSAVRSAMSFEQTLRNTTGLLSGAGRDQASIQQQFLQFSEDIYRLAPQYAQGPQSLAESLYDIVSGGFEGAEATKVLEAAVKGAAAGATDTAVVANALVKSLSAYGYGAEEAGRLTDLMFQSVNLGIISFEDMAQQIGDVVGLAAAARVPFEELMAAIAVMTRKGLVPAEAFTSLNQGMLAIIDQAPAAQEAAAALGIELNGGILASEGMTGVSKRLLDVLRPTADQMERMNSANQAIADSAADEVAGENIEVLTSLFGNVRALRGWLLLASDAGYTFEQAMADMGNAVGATDRVLEEQQKTAQFSMDRLKAYFDVIKLQVASDLLPALADRFEDVGTALGEMMASDDWKTGTAGERIRMLGEFIWGGISGWWEDNKDTVTTKIGEFFTWFGQTAVPHIISMATELGKEVVPALLAGIMSTPEGMAALAVVGGNALRGMIPGLAGGAAGGAGGAAAGAGGLLGPGLLGGVTSLVLSGAIAYLAVTGAIAAYRNTNDELDAAAADLNNEISMAVREAFVTGDYSDLIAGAVNANSNEASNGERLVSWLTQNDTAAEEISGALADLFSQQADVALTPAELQGYYDQIISNEELRTALTDDGMRAIQERMDAAMGALDVQAVQTANALGVGYGYTYTDETAQGMLDEGRFDQLHLAADSARDALEENATNFSESARNYRASADIVRDSNPAMAAAFDAVATTLEGAIVRIQALVPPVLQGPPAPRAGLPTLNGVTAPWSMDKVIRDYTSAATGVPWSIARPSAAGGTGVVTSRTQFTAGEAGAEEVTIRPLRGRGNGGASITIPKLADTIVIREDADIDRIVDRLATELHKRVDNG